MKQLITSLILLTFLAACSKKNLSVIEGTLPDDQYNGEIIYLVPLIDIGPAGVDSVIIQNQSFRFERAGSKEEMMILRLQPTLRLKIQELLVVSEPGQIQVTLDSISSAQGTPQNEDLQRWKEQRAHYDRDYYTLIQMLRTADDSIKEELQARQEALRAEMALFNYELVKKNNQATLGNFIYSHFGRSFSEEQKRELGRE